jgi:uncharacterized protein (TIGR03083 family)
LAHRRIAGPGRKARQRGCGILAHVEQPAYPRFDVPGYVGALRSQGDLLADAAQRAGLAAAVPSCPGWAVRDLLKHTGYVHRWATGFVAEGLTHPVGASEEEILGQGPADDELPGWFRDGHAALVRALGAAAPGLNCWAFLPAPSPLAFWARRQAHETAIHRVDAEQAAARTADQPASTGQPVSAEQAAGTGQPVSTGPASTGPASAAGRATSGNGTTFEPAFAADGVDELVMGFLARNIKRENWAGPGGSLAIHADDGTAGGARWLIAGGRETPGVYPGTGRADCEVAGPASELYLMLWNRGRGDRLQVTGDPGILAAFGRALQVTWS